MYFFENVLPPAILQAFEVDVATKGVVLRNLGEFNTDIMLCPTLGEGNATESEAWPVLKLPL